MQMQCAPAFNYALDAHTTDIIEDDSIASDVPQKKAVFTSKSLSLDLRYVAESTMSDGEGDAPEIALDFLDLSSKGHKGLAIQSNFQLEEGQCVTFVLRTPPSEGSYGPANAGGSNVGRPGKEGFDVIFQPKIMGRPVDDPLLTKELLSALLFVCRLLVYAQTPLPTNMAYISKATNKFWIEWISQSTYTGSWKESVLRSALALKLLVYEPTGELQLKYRVLDLNMMQ